MSLLHRMRTPPSRALNGSRARKVAHWLALRDARYICFRLIALVRRYGISASRAKRRVLDCVDALARHECRPTFPTPGQVVARNGTFCRELQRRGAELAVHGYHHLDFRALSADESRRQFAGAAAAYQRHGIRFEGFRCPYLGYTERLNNTLPNGDFQYSSNKAIWWDVLVPESGRGAGSGAQAVFQGLSRFYRAESSKTHLAVPRLSGHLVEIPVCLPDDLQLLDGLKLDARGMRQAWIDVLRQTHRRGELFDLMFHPESFEQCGPALEAVLREARHLDPPVWIAQLRDINRWWREKSGFSVEPSANGHGVHLTFHCSERATVLVRHLNTDEPTRAWYGPYRVLDGRTLRLSANERPWIGLAADASSAQVAFLRDEGYIVDTGPEARRCAIYLSQAELTGCRNQVQLIDVIETSAAPLIRFWRWPSGSRSALCMTGDLDALSLTDYVARVLAL
jgi:peptidoglycan/xylan/chitin deacetylase (PgdA/CDA1 family)